ncbi:DUF3152 domain-containing protein [Nocardioides houyundeii]|uniref:DUF3152 domain-containing protein n=1 Tax=Nocardioides houyundeii TaxID=2045452 RepID=UPI000C77C62B|nr:DUF3152 domain-containing protein [Nocardioides houyundeii]
MRSRVLMLPVAALLSLLVAVVVAGSGMPASGAATPGALPTPEPTPTLVPTEVPTPVPTQSVTPVPLTELVNVRAPRVRGEARWTRTLRAVPGDWNPRRTRTRFQWLREGEPVRGARARRYRIRPEDVGSRLSVRVRVKAPGLAWTEAVSAPTDRVRHRVGVRRVVTYDVQTRGRVVADLRAFQGLAQATYDDPRGWRNGGVAFRRVAHGGQFTLVLAEAAQVAAFSPVCSSTWSCRVGRYVVINQDRWQHASPAWNAAGLSLRDYRHLVVNHETGHWLGRGHRGCPGRGQRAPVMMQQSKGTQGCTFNPWPTPSEL